MLNVNNSHIYRTEAEGHFTGQLWDTKRSWSNNRGFETKERLIVPQHFCIWPLDLKHFQTVLQNCDWANCALKSAIRTTQTHSNKRASKESINLKDSEEC